MRDFAQAADDALAAAVEGGAAPGVAALVVDANGPIYRGASGERRPGEAMTGSSVVQLASMTKLLTTIVALQLVDEGLIELGAPAGCYVPGIDRLEVLEGWEGDRPVLRPPRSPILVRHLLTHTAGMPYAVWNADQKRYCEWADVPSVRTGDPRALAVALVADPGEAWHYGLATDWLAATAVAVTGEPLGRLLARRILEPLAMRDTGHSITPLMRERLAVIHQREPDGRFAPVPPPATDAPTVEEGGGGLYGTADDYGRLLSALLAGEPLLRADTVASLWTNAIGGLRVPVQRTAMPDRAGDLAFFPDVPKSFGTGLLILEGDAPTGRPRGSGSWSGFANTHFWIDPANGIAGVWVSQLAPFLDPANDAAYLRFESAVYGGRQ